MASIHATCVALENGSGTSPGLIGVLLRGPSGSGKSDLALRLVDAGALLVADDRVVLAHEDGAVVARPPAALAGLLEVRGVGPLPVPAAPAAPVRLVVDLVPPDRVERLPDPRRCSYLGIELPLFALAPFEASAPAKLRLLARAAGTSEAWPAVAP
jgi:serine kinase of HPr protein (carbohydrate metabolism regulator)